MRTITLNPETYLVLENMIPPSANRVYAGMHWSKRKVIADYWHEEIVLAVKKKARLPHPVIIVLTLSFGKGFRRYDADNASFALKMIIDGLVKSRKLAGDSPGFIDAVMLKCERSKDGISRTIVEYSEISRPKAVIVG